MYTFSIKSLSYKKMKKLFVTLFSLIFSISTAVYADDEGLWDNFGDTNIYGQKPVSDQEFEKAIESKKGKKKRDKNTPKGQSFSQSNETESISIIAKEPQILLIPLDLIVADKIIPTGHYQVEGTKENGNVFIKLYQSYNLIAKIPATETDNDFNEQSINFVKLQPHGTNHVQIIYGGLDFNAYTIIDIR